MLLLQEGYHTFRMFGKALFKAAVMRDPLTLHVLNEPESARGEAISNMNKGDALASCYALTC